LKRILKTYDEEHTDIFPHSWKVNQILTTTFCEGTKEDYRTILGRFSRKADGKSLDVDLLLRCLQETLEFEHWLEQRFSGEVWSVSCIKMRSDFITAVKASKENIPRNCGWKRKNLRKSHFGGIRAVSQLVG